jgi:hypothetical protein
MGLWDRNETHVGTEALSSSLNTSMASHLRVYTHAAAHLSVQKL